MSHDFYAKLWEDDRNDLENELKKVKRGNKSQITRNAKNKLPKFFEKRFPANWYSKIKEISLFAKIYEGNDEKNILKIGYDEFILRNLSTDDYAFRMNHDWILKNEDRSTVFGLVANPPAILPTRSSFFLNIKFVLRKPFISKDDEEFYIHDNPISKEKVFKAPYIRASSWKGNLRWVFGKVNDLSEHDEKILRIFGNKKKEENPKYLRKGRLYTYPTFFDKISLDIINPHDRTTKTGKNPITIEVVPKDTEGNLYLLYVPFDRIGEDEQRIKEEIEGDLLLLCKAVRALLTEYGMSAKRTSGYGSAQIEKITFKSALLREYGKYTDLDELIGDLNSRSLINTTSGGETE
jgi:CRISPR-associated protein Cmr2